MKTLIHRLTIFVLLTGLLLGGTIAFAKPPAADDPVWFDLERVLKLKKYQRHLKAYEPNGKYLAQIQQMVEGKETTGFSATMYYGSWCRDSSRELPRLYELMQALGGTLSIVPIDKKKNPLSGAAKPVSRFSVPRMHFYFNGEMIGVREVSMGGKPAKGIVKMLKKYNQKNS